MNIDKIFHISNPFPYIKHDFHLQGTQHYRGEDEIEEGRKKKDIKNELEEMTEA